MTDIIRLRDADGRTHHTARGSQAAEQLLRDGAQDLDAPQGTLDTTAEVTGATEPPAQGDDLDTGTADGGSGDGQRTTRGARRRDRGTGEAQSEPGGERESAG